MSRGTPLARSVRYGHVRPTVPGWRSCLSARPSLEMVRRSRLRTGDHHSHRGFEVPDHPRTAQFLAAHAGHFCANCVVLALDIPARQVSMARHRLAAAGALKSEHAPCARYLMASSEQASSTPAVQPVSLRFIHGPMDPEGPVPAIFWPALMRWNRLRNGHGLTRSFRGTKYGAQLRSITVRLDVCF